MTRRTISNGPHACIQGREAPPGARKPKTDTSVQPVNVNLASPVRPEKPNALHRGKALTVTSSAMPEYPSYPA